MVKQFQLESSYQPAGDQPAAIDQLVSGISAGLASQILLGVTGSGKTEIYLRGVGAALRAGRQALVLVHRGGAQGRDIVALSADIQADIRARFGVDLEREVNVLPQP